MVKIDNILLNVYAQLSVSLPYSYELPLFLWVAFLFASIQPFSWPCDYIDINQLVEVAFWRSKSANFTTYKLLLVPALLAATGDLNQIVSVGESNR